MANSMKSVPDKRPEFLRNLVKRQSEGITADREAVQCGYYRFFYELTKKYKPSVVVEIGTYVGTATAHLSAGYPDALVITVDHNADAKRQVEKLQMPIQAYTSDSIRFVHEKLVDVLPRGAPSIDILYIDGNHTFNQGWGEYVAYRPFVKDGGLIFFDDLALKMDTGEMEVLWHFVPDDKVRLDFLHFTGFGVAKKTPGITPKNWEEVIGPATQMMRK